MHLLRQVPGRDQVREPAAQRWLLFDTWAVRRYGSDNAQRIRFIQCLDTDSSAASTFYFPGQSRDTPKDALVRGRLGPTLKRQYLATPSWSW